MSEKGSIKCNAVQTMELLKCKQDREKMTEFPEETHSRCIFTSGNRCVGSSRVALATQDLAACASETKGRRGSASHMGTIASSSENLAPTAPEQSRQMHSKVRRTHNAGNARQPGG